MRSLEGLLKGGGHWHAGPDIEQEGIIDPIFRVALIVIFSGYQFALRKAIGAEVLFCRDVDELEIK